MACLSSSLSALKNTQMSFTVELFRLDSDLDAAQSDMLSALKLMTETVSHCSVRRDRAAEEAERNFCTVTGLADILVRRFDISFRSAHHITGGMVADAIAAGGDASAMSVGSLRKHSKEILGRELDMSAEELRSALSARENAESKTCVGGPSRLSTGRMLEMSAASIAADREYPRAFRNRLRRACDELDRQCAEIISGA